MASLKIAFAAAAAFMLKFRFLSLRLGRLRVAPLCVDRLGNGSGAHDTSPQYHGARSPANSMKCSCSKALDKDTARGVLFRNELHSEVRDSSECWVSIGDGLNENRDTINKEKVEEVEVEDTRPRPVVGVEQLNQRTWTDPDLEQEAREGSAHKLDTAALDYNSRRVEGSSVFQTSASGCQCINREDSSCSGAEAGKSQLTLMQDAAIDQAVEQVFIHFVSHTGGYLDSLKGSIYQALSCSSAGSVWFTRYFNCVGSFV
jgi:hypothetical protein